MIKRNIVVGGVLIGRAVSQNSVPPSWRVTTDGSFQASNGCARRLTGPWTRCSVPAPVLRVLVLNADYLGGCACRVVGGSAWVTRAAAMDFFTESLPSLLGAASAAVPLLQSQRHHERCPTLYVLVRAILPRRQLTRTLTERWRMR